MVRIHFPDLAAAQDRIAVAARLCMLVLSACLILVAGLIWL